MSVITHAELAARLLREAAEFFQDIATQNEVLQDQMNENAAVFNQVAKMVERDPAGLIRY